MDKFKIGDRVVVTDNGYGFFAAGNTGTIIKFGNDGDCVVKFDTGQPGVNYADGITYDGSWDVRPHHLKHISESQENTPWYETEEGKEWLSSQDSIEEQFVQEKQKRMPKRGERYINVETGSDYILAQSTYCKVFLIDLTNGNRWSDPVKVVDPFAITEDEWTLICADCEFTPVE